MSLEKGDRITPPRRRRGVIVPLLFFCLGVLSVIAFARWHPAGTVLFGNREGAAVSGSTEPAQAKKKEPRILYYADPMNPDNKSDKPGKAPCGMDMVPVYEEGSESAAGGQKGEPRILYYVDPMNPDNKSDKPGKAPCGMDMVPVYEEGEGRSELPPGTVRISSEKQQLIGVQVGEAAESPVRKTMRAVARAAYDETRIAHVHTKFPGWVDKVHVDFVGQLVKKGQPLFSIYSPDLFSTQQELLIAKKSRENLEKSGFEGLQSHSAALYNATRERLRLWDISDAQIRRIERSGTPEKTLTLYSPLNGFVTTRNVYPGQQVSPEMDLYTIADLSTVWIIAEIYEYEVADIRLGQSASVSFPSFPGEKFMGKLTYISPDMDAKTRTLKTRIELANRDFKIKPDMFANVELSVDYGRKLTIPQEAVLDSGESQRVFVVREGGYFEPRKVSLGTRVDDRVIVLDGLKAGERVVTSANFLIDSESQIKSAAGAMSGSHAGHGVQPAKEDHSGHEAPAPVPEHSGHDKKTGADHSGHEQPAASGHAGHGQ
ncbi:MAG: efflux RND transporter periplasmic adaptor subunit [Desulfobacteraceae bacterium]|nr:efflux RND transporter periplasmic adaptor subunit [Desulfobacteraceae bacterium]